jgi:hypothetical protein
MPARTTQAGRGFGVVGGSEAIPVARLVAGADRWETQAHVIAGWNATVIAETIDAYI